MKTIKVTQDQLTLLLTSNQQAINYYLIELNALREKYPTEHNAIEWYVKQIDKLNDLQDQFLG
jgi:hypothetical protein